MTHFTARLMASTAAAVGLALTAAAGHHEEAEMSPESLENYGGYIEYVWVNAGENNSPETFSGFVADWNGEMDAQGSSISAFAYLPTQENDNWDGLWVNAFPNKAARNEAWARYAEAGTEDRLASAHPGVIEPVGETYGDNAYGFYRFDPGELPTPAMSPSVGPDQTPYAVGALFCSFNDGQGWEELSAAISGSYVPWLASLEGLETGYAFAIEVPDFETDQFDYLWKNIHQTADGAAAGGAAWAETGGDVQATFDEIATCTEPSYSTAYVLRWSDS